MEGIPPSSERPQPSRLWGPIMAEEDSGSGNRSCSSLETIAELAQVLDAVVDNVALIAPDYSLLLVNETTARYFGSTKEALVGRKCYECFQTRTTPCEDCPVAVSARTLQPHCVEKISDVTDTWLEIHTTPIFGKDGRLVGVIEHAKDTSAHHREEVARVERERLLAEREEAIRTRDAFLAVASHELRTPLTSLRLQLEMLQRMGTVREPAPAADRRVEAALRQCCRLEDLVNRLLDAVRINAGKQLDLVLEEVDFTQLVRELLDRMDENLTRAGCEARFSGPERVVGRWDRLRVDQIASNILSNAVNYGAGKPIDITLEATGGLARLSVRDNGPGVAGQDHERIFERFERAAHIRHEYYKGLGLGLWIARQAARAMGGEVSVASDVGRGSTFVVELPRSAPER